MNKVRIGIVGAGRIGNVHAQSITYHIPQAEVVCVTDVYEPAAKKLAETYGIPRYGSDFRMIIDDPDIDAVLVCSPTPTHADIAMAAMKAGKDVFCEKPVDLTIEKIQATAQVAKETGRKLQIGFNRRFDHNFKAIRDAVVAGKVGKQQIIKITSRDPEPPSIDYVKISGGIFLDMTIHDFDMVRYLSGAEVEEVYAEGSVTVDPEIGKAGDIDTAIITLKLDNGATAVIDNCRAACYGYDQRAEVFGTKGCVAISNDSDSNAVYSCKDGVIAEKPMFFFLERYMMAYANEVNQFVEAIVNDTPTPVNANDGLQPVLIGLAAKKSVEEHRPVKIAEIRAQYGL